MKIAVVSAKDRDARIQHAIRQAAQIIINMSMDADGAATRMMLQKMHRRLEEDGMQPPPLADFRHAACDIAREVIKRMKFSAELAATLN